MGWIEVLLKTLEDPLGPVVSLSELLSTNEKLLAKHATTHLAKKFVGMIESLGPQSRFLLFFSKICSVQNVPMIANQELILRNLFIDKEQNEQILLSLSFADVLNKKKRVSV